MSDRVNRHHISEATSLVCSSIWGAVCALSTSQTTVILAGVFALVWAVYAVAAAYASKLKEGNQ